MSMDEQNLVKRKTAGHKLYGTAAGLKVLAQQARQVEHLTDIQDYDPGIGQMINNAIAALRNFRDLQA